MNAIDPDLHQVMAAIGRRARAAAATLAFAPTEAKNLALIAAADAVLAGSEAILAANAEDIAAAKERGISPAFLDRLTLTEARIAAIAAGLRDIAALPDPVGAVMASWTRPNGLEISRVRTPLGVIGVIFESRPNVTADAGALTLKSGNAVILRGGSDSARSSRAIHAGLLAGLEAAGLPADAIQLVPTTDRAAVGEMLRGLDGNIDVIVPRGGKTLVARVEEEARVPVFAHLEGICHTYVDKGAELVMAVNVVVNAKMRRPGVCGATETLLLHRDVVATHLKPIADALIARGCEIRGDDTVRRLIPEAIPATEEDWRTEYEAPILSVKVVDDVGAAIAHINRYGSHHTEAILSENEANIARFFTETDSAILILNASTQYADGGEFGFGGEIGIATGKFHARGPVGLEQLCSFKYLVRGNGQTRP
ncbi:MAG: glutamate-5-semialdehyde dehydrogenase [Devosia sp. 67-54]|uniref:glutamate-5-semialdehyde dehydrogenase n=1 Tax=unclassified Devosia TaxID=196773 RepID=UPI00095EA8B6|nr:MULTISPECIES: glutamate-5-semialdehyde dehydrogenase [unclassified Devosia]MBN9307199.1 glutamate-5-semialdehyde dehydrogenase [Devosia sp.]OJX19594.1 MAG: glutamate-5-semialdehyde dehydrogenase [Devosia sp. 67-54]